MSAPSDTAPGAGRGGEVLNDHVGKSQAEEMRSTVSEFTKNSGGSQGGFPNGLLFPLAPGRDKPDLGLCAEQYALNGIPIFPCNCLKRPLTVGGFKAATTNLEQIRAWWKRWPNALIGMPTGHVSGLYLVDIDVKRGVDGFATLAALEAKYGRLPRTLTARTPSGGLHLYFLMPDSDPPLGNSAGKIGPGIDTRGQGGYSILPPSSTDEGRYEWLSYE